jgi:hypothetical protein
MVTVLINPITSHQLTLMPSTPQTPEMFGWIRLVHEARSAGYIYLSNEPQKPHLSSDGTYIVTSIPMSELSTMLDILRNEGNLQIRYFDSNITGAEVSVFIESVGEETAEAIAVMEEAKSLRLHS